jgi:putative membrane protein
MTPGPILSPADNDRIAAAVGAAEAHANAEIVTVVTRGSDSYGDVALAWSAGIAGLALAVLTIATGFYLGLADRALGLWDHHWSPREVLGLALVVASVTFAAVWAILLWRRLRLMLTPGPVKAMRVRARAAMAFHLAAQGRTRGATGVLIYLSMAERRAEIIADASIAAKVSPEVWGDAMHAMLDHFRNDRVADGMIAGVAAVGKVVTGHFPRDDKPANELPDGPIEL